MTTAALPDNAKELFVDLSKVLIGVARSEPVPAMQDDAITQNYFNLALQTDGHTFSQLLSLYQSKQAESEETLEHLLLNQSSAQVRYLARSIMLAWYLGSWYTPQDLAHPPSFGTLTATPIVAQNTASANESAEESSAWRLALTLPFPHFKQNTHAFY